MCLYRWSRQHRVCLDEEDKDEEEESVHDDDEQDVDKINHTVCVKMIIGIVKGIHGIPQQTTYIDAFVFVAFLAMHQIICIPILIKLDQANVSGFGMLGVILASNEYIGFEWSWISQCIVSLITFLIVYTISSN